KDQVLDVFNVTPPKMRVAAAKLTHAVNQQTSAVTTTMTAILKQFQATPPPASMKSCLAANGNTFSELQDNIQGYVSAAAVNYNQGNSGYRPLSVANQIRPLVFAQENVENNQNRFSQPQGYNQGNNFNQDQSYQAPTQQNQVVPLEEDERVEETLTDHDLVEYTIKVPPPLVQKLKPHS
nr:hypothetical protein [Tanacetum cinerariifolium]